MSFAVPAERRAQVCKECALSERDLYDAAGAITLRCADNIVLSDVLGEVSGPVAMTAAGGPTPSAANWSAQQLAGDLGDQPDHLDAAALRVLDVLGVRVEAGKCRDGRAFDTFATSFRQLAWFSAAAGCLTGNARGLQAPNSSAVSVSCFQRS